MGANRKNHCCADGAVRLLDLESTRPRAGKNRHSRRVTSLLQVPEGRIVVSGSLDRTLKIWRSPSDDGELFVTLGEPVTTLALGPEGRILAGASSGLICAWRLTGSPRVSLEGHRDQITALVTTADGRVISGSADGELRIWNLHTRQSIIMKGHSARINVLMMLPDGRLTSASQDNTVRIWDLSLATGTVLVDQGSGVSVLAVCNRDRILAGGRMGPCTL